MYQIVEFLLRTTNETQLKSLLPGLILILLSLHLIKFDAGYGNSPRKKKQNKKLSQKIWGHKVNNKLMISVWFRLKPLLEKTILNGI